MQCLFSQEDCSVILNRSIKNQSVTFIRQEVSKFSDTMLGYMAEHFLLTLHYTTSDTVVKKISFFVKGLPQDNKEQKEFIESTGMLNKEGNLYQNLIAQLHALVNTPFCPKLYFCSEHVMVFENLETRHFAMLPKGYLDWTKLISGIKTMAIMHGAGLILEEKKRKTNKSYTLKEECPEELTDYMLDYTEGHKRNNWVKAAVRCVGDLCVYFTGDCSYKEKVLQYLDLVMKTLDENFKESRNVLCHNDLWVNNLMFNKANECIFVDFQLAKYGPPAYDLWVFLYFNTQRQLLKDNLQDFLDVYFNVLEDELKKASIEVSLVMTKESFQKSVEFYAQPALFQVSFCGTYIYTTEAFVTKMMPDKKMYEDFNFGERSKYILEEIKHDKECGERLKNIILPLCDMFSQ